MGVELLYPMHTYLIVSAYEGKTNVMAADWVIPVSYRPFRVGVALSPKRFTYELIKKSGEFVVSVPSVELKEKVIKVGNISGRVEDKSKYFKFKKGKRIGTPLIEECLANLECVLWDEKNCGDHNLVIGEVVAEDYSPEVYRDGTPTELSRFLVHTWGKFTTFYDKYL